MGKPVPVALPALVSRRCMLCDPVEHGWNCQAERASLQHEAPMRCPFDAEIVRRQPEVIIALTWPCPVPRSSHYEEWTGQRLDDDTPLALVSRQPGFTTNRGQGNQALLAIQVRHSRLRVRVTTRDAILLPSKFTRAQHYRGVTLPCRGTRRQPHTGAGHASRC